LRKTPAGCDWLKAQWLGLYERVHEDDCFFNSERIRSCFLLGKRLWEVLDDPTLREFYRYLLGGLLDLHPECRPIVVQLFRLELPTEEQGYLDDGEFEKRLNHMVATELPAACAEAAELMRGFIARQMAELDARAARLRRERAEDGRLATGGASLDGSPTTARRERQVAMYYRRAELANGNAERLRDKRLAEDESEASSSPAPAEAPTTAGPDQPQTENLQPAVDGSHQAAPPAAPDESRTEDSRPTSDSVRPEPPAAPDESGVAATVASDGRGGLGAGPILPALVLLLLVPLLGGPRRETVPQARQVHGVAWAVGTSAVGRTDSAVVASRRVGRVRPTSIHRGQAHVGRHGHRWASSRHVGVRPTRPRARAHGQGHGVLARRVNVVLHPLAFRLPKRAWAHTLGCRFDPKLNASRVMAGESSFGPQKALRIGPRARNSPGLRGPPAERP
jgi:hypothetical protein